MDLKHDKSSDNTSLIEKQCIICLEDIELCKSNENPIYDIDKYNETLAKTCQCVYTIHEECILNWIKTNPTCPYCTKYLYFKHNIKSCSLSTDELQSSDQQIIINIPSESNIEYYSRDNKSCLRTILVIIILILFIAVINNIFF